MELWIRAIKNKQTTDGNLRDVFEKYSNEPIEEQDIDEFVFDYDRTDERLFIPIFKNNVMFVSDDNRAIIKKENVETIYFINKLFVATDKYCDKNTSPQHLCENFVSYYISADRICMLTIECFDFIRMLEMRLLRNPIYKDAQEMITKIQNLQKFLENNKSKCDEFVINFEESEVKILEPRLRLNVENKSTVSKISHKPRRR